MNDLDLLLDMSNTQIYMHCIELARDSNKEELHRLLTYPKVVEALKSSIYEYDKGSACDRLMLTLEWEWECEVSMWGTERRRRKS